MPKKQSKSGSVANALASSRREAKEAPKESAPSSGGGWFQTGYDSVGEEVARREAQQEEWENQIRRFWMPQKDQETGQPVKAVIVFIDGIPFTYREHNLYLNGHWRNWKTCLIGTGEKCPFDEAGNKNAFIGAYTVIDTRQWKSKDGTIHKNEVSLYASKGDALKALRINAEAHGGDLAGCVYQVSRTGDKSPSTGNVLVFIEKLPTRKYKVTIPGAGTREINILDTANPAVAKKFGAKGLIKPIDYPTVLAPMSRAEALKWMASQNITAGNAASGESASEVAY